MDSAFSTDDERTYFLAKLFVHPDLLGIVEAHDGAHERITETEQQIPAFVEDTPKSRQQIANHLGVKSRNGHLYKSLQHLREINFIEFTIPDKPQSKNQKMKMTEAGRRWLAEIKNANS